MVPMTLFSEAERQLILERLNGRKGNFVIAFRNRHGPTRLHKLWTELLEDLGLKHKRCINWWSSAGTVGLLECEIDDDLMIYGQWMLCDRDELLGVFSVADEEVVNIKDGFDAGNVSSVAMRAIRIGETGEQD